MSDTGDDIVDLVSFLVSDRLELKSMAADILQVGTRCSPPHPQQHEDSLSLSRLCFYDLFLVHIFRA